MSVLRKMRISDLDQVVFIEKDLFVDPWSRESFIFDLLNNSNSFSFVLEKDGEILGYIIGWLIEDEIHIGNIAVKRKYQGQGIGSTLLKYLFGIYDDSFRWFLEVRQTNLKARRLYHKFGFRLLHRRKKYYSDGEDALVMIKAQNRV